MDTRPGPTGLTARLQVRLADIADPRPDGQPGEWVTDALQAAIYADEAALKRRSHRP